jgi:hypothetical protein
MLKTYLSKSFLAIQASVLVIGVMISIQSRAQNKVDLEDLTIKGDLNSDNRLNLSNRDPASQAERVTYRDNFRPEVTDSLETPWPDQDAKTTNDQTPAEGGK